ncbi:MAG: arginase [Clostridiales bacterium]|jgi:arginase|nr:arginase [Eubacteriales bacterium]MDH7566757.1 arginase [Clostridiales bacterium]
MAANIDIIGVPIDLGANRRGVDMGPSAIRYAGLKKAVTRLNINCRDLGNINVPVPENSDENADIKMKYIEEITEVNRILAGKVSQSLMGGSMPVVLGGDHSIAVGTILGTQHILKNIGVIWMDAHGDFNTEHTTLTGNLHGMSLAASTGCGALAMASFKPEDTNYINPEKVVLIGVRSLDDEEAVLVKKSGVTVFTMADIDMYGMKEIMKRALDIVENGTEGFHLSYDMDVVSPNEAPGVGTPVKGGLTYREAHLAAEMISDSRKLCSMEFVEVNPIMDHVNQTGELAVSLICSVLGKKIICDR